MAAVVAVIGVGAAAMAQAASDGFRPSKVIVLEAPQEQFEKRLIWDGKDIDGDGAADFQNPTGKAPRIHDAYGHGWFGASRDGGTRDHEGVDYAGDAGAAAVAPISGYVTRIGQAYDNAPELKYVEISNPALGYEARVFYVRPQVVVGQAVVIGETIGKIADLTRRYPGGMTNHVHLELMDRAGERIDSTTVITARVEMVPVI